MCVCLCVCLSVCSFNLTSRKVNFRLNDEFNLINFSNWEVFDDHINTLNFGKCIWILFLGIVVIPLLKEEYWHFPQISGKSQTHNVELFKKGQISLILAVSFPIGDLSYLNIESLDAC